MELSWQHVGTYESKMTRISRIYKFWESAPNQILIFYPLWLFSWYNKPFDDVNVLSHAEQMNDFSPVCVLSSWFKTFDIVNDLPHFEQLNGLYELWVLSWYNKPFYDVNVLSHADDFSSMISHQYMFFHVSCKWLATFWAAECLYELWVLSWYNKPFDDVNVLSHAEQMNDFSPVCVLSCWFKTFDI